MQRAMDNYTQDFVPDSNTLVCSMIDDSVHTNR